MKYSHLFLKNPIGSKDYVNTMRFVPPKEEEDEENNRTLDYSYQKEKLRSNLGKFDDERITREHQRNIELDIPYHFEYLQINFFTHFNDDSNYYYKKFGLTPVSYLNFNKSVLFLIELPDRFKKFIQFIEQFSNSAENTNPEEHEYHTITLVESFEFLSSFKIKNNIEDRAIISLTRTLDYKQEWRVVKKKLYSFIRSKNGRLSEVSDGILEVSNIGEYLDLIADNFDIIQKIQASPVFKVRKSSFGQTIFDWGFNAVNNDDLPIVGVIDTGISPITPLKPLIKDNISILNKQRGIKSSHGTAVASLVAFGNRILIDEEEKNADANLCSIQILYDQEGDFSSDKLKQTIINTHNNFGIRIFNLSVCSSLSFNYNDNISQYAIMLDELAYQFDLLIFIAAGNLYEDYIDDITAFYPDTANEIINYPNHFYNPICHDSSQPTNIGCPAESMNNFTIGAIAANNENESSDLTLNHHLPAYYSRKFHIDYSQKINGTLCSRNQINYNINKPDILMPGGDWHKDNCKMTVLGKGEFGNDYYIHLAGTSLATPLAANLAAKIIKKYPSINMQSVKALMINAAQTTNIQALLDSTIEQLKNKMAKDIYKKNFDRLSQGEKMKISGLYNVKNVAKRIEGYGVPIDDYCLSSTEKRVTFIIENIIKINHHKVQHIKIPDYLSRASKQNILTISATLCFKFSPTKNDHISYNPIHISFRFINAQENSQDSADVVANKKK